MLLALILGGQVAFGAEKSASAEGKPVLANSKKTVRLLTIGNSFSKNATHFLGDLATAGGCKLVHHSIVVGGASLQLHAEQAQLAEREPNNKAGRYSNGRTLKEELASERWDFVTIQQASVKSHDVSSYRPFAGWLRDYIKQHAPQAQLLVHQTWEYRSDDPRFASTNAKAGEPATQEAMWQGLSKAYGTIAGELGARQIPVGAAFHRLDHDPKWAYQADPSFVFKNARPPRLPKQTHSLHAGWQWKKQSDGTLALVLDGHHASAAGEYLGACVFFEVLFGESVVGNAFVPTGITPADARYLQENAHAVVLAGAK